MTGIAAGLLFPNPAKCQYVFVSPDTGMSTTHFFVGGGGFRAFWPPCPHDGGGCSTFGGVQIDGYGVWSLSNCQHSFAFSIQQVVATFPEYYSILSPGIHNVEFHTQSDCSNPDGPLDEACVTTTYTIVSAETNGDPWASFPNPDSLTIQFAFSPCDAQDIAPCDSIYVIQSVRSRALEDGELRPYSYAEERWPNAATRDSLRTSAGYSIDGVVTGDPRAGKRPGTGSPYYPTRPGYKVGATCKTVNFIDRPLLPHLSYQPNVESITKEFELNLFCAVGEGIGQWLGRATWTWTQDEDAIGSPRLRPTSYDRSQPTTEFLDALEVWCSKFGFTLPTPSATSKNSGGSICP